MQKFFELAVLLSFLFTFGSLSAQESSGAEQTKTLNEKFYGNSDYMQAAQLIEEEQLAEAVPLLQQVSTAFEQEKQWEALIAVSKTIVNNYIYSPQGVKLAPTVLHTLNSIEDQVPKRSIECIGIYNLLGIIYSKAGIQEKKLTCSLKALEILKREGAEHMSYQVGVAYMNLGNAYDNLGQSELGIPYFEEAIRIGREAKNCDKCPQVLANSLTNLGTTYRLMGNLDKAIEYISQGIEVYEASHAEYDIGLVPQYFSIAYVYYTLKEYEAGSLYFKKIISVIKQSGTQYEFYLKRAFRNAISKLADFMRIGEIMKMP